MEYVDICQFFIFVYYCRIITGWKCTNPVAIRKAKNNKTSSESFSINKLKFWNGSRGSADRRGVLERGHSCADRRGVLKRSLKLRRSSRNFERESKLHFRIFAFSRLLSLSFVLLRCVAFLHVFHFLIFLFLSSV